MQLLKTNKGIALLTVLFLPLAGLQADDTKASAKKTDTKSAASAAEEKEEESQIMKSLSMLPLGKTNFGVKLPEYKNGKLMSLVIAGKLTPIEKDRIFMEEIRIQTMDDEGAQEMEIRMITGSFDVTNEFLSSDDETVITRPDFTITGDSLDYDKKNGKGILRGKVKMVIRNEFFNKDEEKKDATSTEKDADGLSIKAGVDDLKIDDLILDADLDVNIQKDDKETKK